MKVLKQTKEETMKIDEEIAKYIINHQKKTVNNCF